MSQTERLAYLDRKLRERGWVTTQEAAQHFEVSPRQIKRDIEYLRWRLNAPLIYDRRTCRYRYETPFSELRFADERRVLFSALVKGWATSADVGPLVTPEILKSVEAGVSRDFRLVADCIVYRAASTDPIDLEIFSGLCRGLRESRVVEIDYGGTDGNLTTRRIETQRLIHYEGTWYLLAYDHNRADLRTFHLGRIRALRLTAETALKSHDDEEWQKQVRQATTSQYGMFQGAATHWATVRLTGQALARAQPQSWHLAQRDIRADDGTWLERSIPVSDFREITSRVLAWGADAEPLTPPEFRQAWVREIQALATRASISLRSP